MMTRAGKPYIYIYIYGYIYIDSIINIYIYSRIYIFIYLFIIISYKTQHHLGIKHQTVSSSNLMAHGTTQPRQQEHNVSKHAVPHYSHLWAGPGRDRSMPH
jgi:hypothetical protein